MMNPQLFMQIDTTTPLRLSPKTFINREDENYFAIGLYDKEIVRKFLKHLITAVYSFTNWLPPGDLILMWPPDTVNDLLCILISMRKDKILINQEEYDEIINDVTIDTSYDEQDYLIDKVWLEAYSEAIKTIPQNSRVLHLGAKGAGYQSLEMAKSSIDKIVATPIDIPNTYLAKQKAHNQNLDNVEFIFSKNQKFSGICFAEKFNVFVTELFSSGTFEERILETTLMAKEKLLSSDCQFIPAKFDLKVFAYQAPIHIDMVQETSEFELMYGLKFEAFAKTLAIHIMGNYFRLDPNETTRLSNDITVKTFDLSTLEKPVFEETFTIEINKPGKVSGFCAFFDLHLTPEIKLSNSPFAPKIQYMQRIFSPGGSLYMEAGDKINLKASYEDGNFRILFT